MEYILKYFPKLSQNQIDQFTRLKELYMFWNARINIISRKDIDNLYLHHVLHSLSLAKVNQFVPGTKILDVGTGGGFPGVPLAILFPNVKFHLIDSINKKIDVVDEIITKVKLTNCQTACTRAERITLKYDFIISRAVTNLPKFLSWVKENISFVNKNQMKNGILYLKGGDIEEEISKINGTIKIFNIEDYFEEDYFLTKRIVYISI